jgi:NADPH-ferrihemoprotein reductase
MWRLSFINSIALVAVLLSLISHLARKYIPKYFGHPSSSPRLQPQQTSKQPTTSTRDICKKLDQCDKNWVIFYGSQTGTAEKLASRLAKEGSAKFGLKTIVADFDDFDDNSLDAFSPKKLPCLSLLHMARANQQTVPLPFTDL